MRRLTAAVLAAAAVGTTVVAIVSGAIDAAVRAEVVVAGEGHPLDVRRIRIVDGLQPGERYRLPTFGVRNHSAVRTTYHPIVSAAAAQGERRAPRNWLRFVPAAVAIDAGRSRAVLVRLELPDGAEPGVYAVVLGVRPGDSEGARLTFRIEPAASTGVWLRQGTILALWVVPALMGAVLVVLLVRGQRTGSKRLTPLRSTMRVRRDH